MSLNLTTPSQANPISAMAFRNIPELTSPTNPRPGAVTIPSATNNGTWDVFTGPIEDIYGVVIIPEDMQIPDGDLHYMLWYVANIIAIPPPMG